MFTCEVSSTPAVLRRVGLLLACVMLAVAVQHPLAPSRAPRSPRRG